MWDPYADFQTIVLPNGLTVHLLHWSDRSWVNVRFVIHSGARSDQLGFEGTAHFVEHLVSKNAKLPYLDLRNYFHDVGGGVDTGRTNFLATQYGFNIPDDNGVLAEAFEIMGSMLMISDLDNYIERERQVILSEYHKSFPMKFWADLLWKERNDVYSWTWLSRFISPLGAPESITGIPPHILKEYYDTHYVPANMSVVVVGGITMVELVEAILLSPFGVSKPGERNPLPRRMKMVSSPTHDGGVLVYSQHVKMDKPREKAEFKSICCMPGELPKKALAIIYQMLQVNLFEEIRSKRGWAYAVQVGYQDYLSFYEFRIGCEGLALEGVDHIQSIIEEVIDSLPLNEELFEKVKARFIASYKTRDQTGKGIGEGASVDLILSGHIRTFYEEIEEFNKVTLDDVTRAVEWMKGPHRWNRLIVP